jgi:hypothetical protein
MYKLQWASGVIPNLPPILNRIRISETSYAGYHALYSGTRRWVHWGSATRWIKNTAGRYRALRHSLTQFANSDRCL